MRVLALVPLALAVTSSPLFALESAADSTAPQAGVRKGAPSPVPEKAATAVGGKWKIERLAERLAQPGEGGRDTVYWELLNLSEKDPKACQDADIETVLEWLAFETSLLCDPKIDESACVKLPKLFPGMGQKLLVTLLKAWLPSVDEGGTMPQEPWYWLNGRKIDQKVFVAAARELKATGPQYNPVAKLWIASVLVAADDPNGLKELAAARTDLAQQLPERAASLYRQVVLGLAECGVRQALPLLLAPAEQEMRAGPGEWSLTEVQRLLSWPYMEQQSAEQSKGEVAKMREWLNANLDKLAWDNARRCFNCEVAPPGRESAHRTAKEAEKKYGIKPLDPMRGGERIDVLNEIVAIMEKDQAAAADPVLADLFLDRVKELSAGAPLGPAYSGTNIMQLLTRLCGVNRGLAVRLSALFIRDTLVRLDGPSSFGLCPSPKTDPALLKDALASLLPEFGKAYEEAHKTGDADKALTAAMKLVCVGGRPDKKTMLELLDKASPEWTAKQSQKLAIWGGRMHDAGLISSMRITLLLAAREIKSYDPKGGGGIYPLASFQYTCGWTDNASGLSGNPEELLAQCEKWFDENEAVLHWDDRRAHLVGATPPTRAPLVKAAAVLPARYGIKTDATATPNFQDLRKLFDDLLVLMQNNKEAAADPAVREVILGLLEPARILRDLPYENKALVALPKANRALGVKVWACHLDNVLPSLAESHWLPCLPLLLCPSLLPSLRGTGQCHDGGADMLRQSWPCGNHAGQIQWEFWFTLWRKASSLSGYLAGKVAV